MASTLSKGTRTTSARTRRAGALAVALLALAPALACSAAPAGSSQVVRGTVTPEFAVGIDANGNIQTQATTIPATVTRKRENGVEIVTVVPLQ